MSSRYRIFHIFFRFFIVFNSVVSCGTTAAESLNLWKNVPHPTASLMTASDLCKSCLIIRLLRFYKPRQIILSHSSEPSSSHLCALKQQIHLQHLSIYYHNFLSDVYKISHSLLLSDIACAIINHEQSSYLTGELEKTG